MKPKYRIVQAVTKQQLATVKLLDRRIFPKDKPVLIKDALWWIAYRGKRPVGFAGMALHPTFGFLRRAGVYASEQGRGLHTRLIQVRLRYLRSINYPLAITYTSYDNKRSANNLLRCGFRLYTPQENFGTRNAFYMEWTP